MLKERKKANITKDEDKMLPTKPPRTLPTTARPDFDAQLHLAS